MSQYSRKTKTVSIVLSMWLVFDTTGLAMQPLGDAELSEESGAGLAFPFENIRLEMDKTSFIELTGSDTNLCNTGSTTVPAGCTTFRRGDLRYYGLSMTSGATGSGTDWYGNGCTPGTFGLGCPLNSGAIVNYSNFDNPFVLRVFNHADKIGTDGNAADRTVLELVGPSNMDAFRWAFFGEVESGRTYAAPDGTGYRAISGATCGANGALSGLSCLLKTQNIILGKPASRLKPPSIAGSNDSTNPYYGPVLRMMQYMGTTASSGSNPATYGIQYESRLSGNYRFSVNVTSATASLGRGVVPDFTDEEGMYFMNVQAYLPLGQLHYQALVFDDTQPGSSGTVTTNGNITMEVTRIPNVLGVYRDFYSCGSTGLDCSNSGSAAAGYTRANRTDRYYQTHGYVEWGTGFPTCSGTNCMTGSGVSSVRYSGLDPDGPTRAINATNFPAPTYFTSGRPSDVSADAPVAPNCNSPSYCTYQAGTVGDVLSAPTTTRDQVITAGGIVFVSRDSNSTWGVLNNQNQAETPLYMLWVNNTSSNGGGGNWASTYRLERDGRYSAANLTNPMLKVNAINTGSARVSGLLMNHLKIETLGGQ